MSSDTHDAKEKLLSSFGIGLEAAKLAINTEASARAIFDHAVALIADLLPKKDIVHPETARRILEAGFDYGVDWSQGPYGDKGLSGGVTQAKDTMWYHFKENHDAGTFAEPKQPVTFDSLIKETLEKPAEPARPLKDMMAPGLLPGKEPSVGTLDTWFNKGMKARDEKTQCPYAPNSVAAYMHVKGWVFRDIQIIACRFCSSYAREQIQSGNITQEQIDEYARNGRQK